MRNYEKKRILKPRYDTGTDDKQYQYYGTPEQLANPNTIWDYPEAKDGAVITPKGNYADTQQYIAATHGSAYDPNAPFEMVNQLVFNSAPALFDTAYQGITGQYGKQGTSTPAQNAMGMLYRYTAPSRWVGSAKSLLPGYTFSLPWDDDNPGVTGNPNLDGVFDILVGKGLGESETLGSFKDKVNNTVKRSLKKPIANILYAPSYLKKDRNSNNNVYGVANRYYTDRYNIHSDYDSFTLNTLFDFGDTDYKPLHPFKHLGNTVLENNVLFPKKSYAGDTKFRPFSTKMYYYNGIPTKYPNQFKRGLTEKLYKNISKNLSSLKENFYKDDDDIIVNVGEYFKYRPMESSYLQHLMNIGALGRLQADTGINFSTFLHDPNRFMKVYEDKLKFKDYLSEHPSLRKNTNLFSTSYNEGYRDYGIGTITASDELKDFINNIQLKKTYLRGIPYAKILDFNPDDISSYLGYDSESPLFGGKVVGTHYPASGRSVVQPSTEAKLMSTLLHEDYSHRTDKKIGRDDQIVYDIGKYLKNPINEASKSWYESRSTMNELGFRLWKDFGKPDLSTFRQYIDNLSEDTILDILNDINGYGRDYVESARKDPKTGQRIVRNIKTILKWLPIATAPVMLRKPNDNNKQ